MEFLPNPIKKLVDSHKESVNKRIASGIEKDLLRERYLDERDYIIKDLKDKAQNGNYAEAKEIIDLYADVVTDDMAFETIKKEINQKYIEQTSAQREYEKLKTQLEVTPKDEHDKRLKLYRELEKLEPGCLEWQTGVYDCEIALGLRAKVSDDLRLGCIVKKWSGWSPEQESGINISSGDIRIRVHTHGLSIQHFTGVYRIHYSQILELKYKSGSLSDVLSYAVAGAIVGLFTIGVGLGALAAAGEALNWLVIKYWDLASNSCKEIALKGNSEAQINALIECYHREIEITKKTKRQPQIENLSTLKAACWIGGIILFFACVSTCVSGGSQNKTDTSLPVVKEVPVTTPQPVNQPSMVENAQWVASAKSCSIQNAGTTVSVLGTSASSSKIEISGMQVTNCEQISIAFDNNPYKTPKCSISGDKVTLSGSERFIKKMRQSANMTITYPMDNSGDKSIVYTLMGFSKACPAAVVGE